MVIDPLCSRAKDALHAVSVGITDDAAHVAALEHVAIAVIDLFEGVFARDHVVEVKLPQLVQFENRRDVVLRVAAAKDAALQAFLQQRESRKVQGDVGWPSRLPCR